MQHNPVSLAIESLQEQWNSEASGDFKVIRWLIKDDETALLNGFLEVESSPHGQCEDAFLVLFTPYVYEPGVYSLHLTQDLFRMWDEDSHVKTARLQWDRSSFLPRMENTEGANQLLCDVLTDFKQQFGKDGQRLVLGLLPSTIEDVADYNEWIIETAALLPEGICLCLTDYTGPENFKRAAETLDSKLQTLRCARFDMRQMAADLLAAQPDPENPQTAFRQCVLKMSLATENKDKAALNGWGAEALKAAQRSGSQAFLATAYLVYAGFMMQFKDREALQLLQKGEQLAQMACDNKEDEGVSVLMQIYGYYSAYYSIMGHRETACEWSLRQGEYAAGNGLKAYAISIYRHTAQLAASSLTELRREALARGYAVSEGLTDDELKASEIRMVAHHYIEELQQTDDPTAATEAEQRMSALFGSEWHEGIPSLQDKHAQINLDFNP